MKTEVLGDKIRSKIGFLRSEKRHAVGREIFSCHALRGPSVILFFGSILGAF
jgi:hypothetical protein